MSDALVPVLRRSAIEAASNCLYRYQQIWLKGVPDTSDPAMRGIAFHACAHRYILRLVAKGLSQDMEEAHAAFQEGIASVEQIPGRLVKEVRELFDNWSEHLFELDVDAYVTSEEHQGRSEQGFTPDLVLARGHTLEIVDFKTFWVGLTEAQAKADMQARWYTRNAHVQWPNFAEYRFTFSFVRFGTSMSVTFTHQELDEANREVMAVLGTIQRAAETETWPATPGPMCAFCELKCPAVDVEPLMPKRLTTADQAQQIAAWTAAADKVVKTAKKALKAYCAANGPVVVNGLEWNNRPVLQRSYPIADVLAALNQAGAVGAFDAPDAPTLSHSALAKIFRAFPALQTLLAPLVREKTTFRFSSRAAGQDDETEDEA